MRILFVVPKMTSGGAERVIANLSNSFCKENEVRIVAFASRESFYKLDKRVELCGRDLTINRRNRVSVLWCYAKNFFGALRFVKSEIKEYKPDCTISFLVEADILTNMATKRNHKIVKVFSERNDPTQRGLLTKLFLKRVYKKADLFVCQSEKVFDYYSFIPSSNKVIIPNPVFTDSLPEPSIKEKSHDIVSVGRLFGQKNHELLMEAFVLALDKIPEDSKLIIYGEGPLRKKYEAFIGTHNVEKRVVLAGKTSDVAKKIKEASLFVLPSNYEGFPNALLEAMALGLPVISTDFYTGTARELISEDGGRIVPVGDVKKMSNAIIEIMSNSELRTRMRRNNTFVREKYAIKKIEEAWLDEISKRMKAK